MLYKLWAVNTCIIADVKEALRLLQMCTRTRICDLWLAFFFLAHSVDSHESLCCHFRASVCTIYTYKVPSTWVAEGSRASWVISYDLSAEKVIGSNLLSTVTTTFLHHMYVQPSHSRRGRYYWIPQCERFYLSDGRKRFCPFKPSCERGYSSSGAGTSRGFKIQTQSIETMKPCGA